MGYQRTSGTAEKFVLFFMFDIFQSLARFVKWEYFEDGEENEMAYTRCHGFHQRGTCVFGAGDVGQVS